ncbi:MAG: squalene/phytoene synthase family protein, partial [Pseudomonadota bacterium]
MTAPDPIDEEVRAADRDRYDAARAAEAPARADLVTLYALNLELARTPWRVSEPQLGAMRLQWWADLFEAAETGAAPRGAPLVERISDWVRRRRPPQALLRALAEARLRELDDTPMESAEALDAFLSGTARSRTASSRPSQAIQAASRISVPA